jgi:hypothetical protein
MAIQRTLASFAPLDNRWQQVERLPGKPPLNWLKSRKQLCDWMGQANGDDNWNTKHSDRGAAYLTECAKAIKARVDIPIQAQCEPPDDFIWFDRMKAAGIDSLGMHLERLTPQFGQELCRVKQQSLWSITLRHLQPQSRSSVGDR